MRRTRVSLLVSLLLFLFWMTALSVSRTRGPKILDSGAAQYQAVARASFNVFACVAIVALVFRANPSRVFIGIAGILGLCLLFLSRRLWRAWVLRRRAHGSFLANALVIGGVRSAQDIMRRFISDPVHGLRWLASGSQIGLLGARSGSMSGKPISP